MNGFMNGVRANIPLTPSVIAYSSVLGVLAAQKSIAWTYIMALNVFMFAGSAQFVMVDMWADPLPVTEMAIAATIVNMRYILIAASLKDLFAGQGLLRRMSIMHFVADENWAMTMVAARKGQADIFHLLGGGMFLMLVWSCGTMAGMSLGGIIPDPQVLALDFAFTAVFTALAVSLWQGRQDVLPWMVAITASVLTEHFVPGKWYILVGGVSGAACAAFTAPQREKA
ncbi:Predicted branched-chain amino acid permease (azaleucine resistance) [Maridesulfovibrio ferrireducens]|uniref:Predicted branched-chain amino acid permease (Azaleucine resistance) n=1 Tax=Maridesulfovibrio ferrireducens TaxID=246191 RepID=A0A1G9H9Y0_9BACT|nr:AzlC family ABC transporter permease [Maridesulfovibrio ferrireducens]SDL09707.1 Predicted branched-chain amino acid permease (azaleucine resistance) [Maridesulfovibrio ferrireducens]